MLGIKLKFLHTICISAFVKTKVVAARLNTALAVRARLLDSIWPRVASDIRTLEMQTYCTYLSLDQVNFVSKSPAYPVSSVGAVTRLKTLIFNTWRRAHLGAFSCYLDSCYLLIYTEHSY